MSEFITVLQAVLPVFAIMTVGLWIRRRGWLSTDADASLMRLCINLLIPSLIFNSVFGNAALCRLENLLLPPLVGFGMAGLGMAVAGMFAKSAGLQTRPEQRTFAFLAGLQNYAYLVIPLCISLFDTGTTGVLFVHNVGTEMAMWTIGVAVLTGSGLISGWRKFINAPLVALVLALALNIIGMAFTPPATVAEAGKILLTTIHWLGQSAIPLGLLLIGAIVADHLEEARGGKALRVVNVAALVRLGIMPVLFILLAKYLPCSVELKRVIVLQGAMPSAVLPIVISKHYGGDARVALQVALGTSVIGLLTIPMWIHFGGYFAGLWSSAL